MSNEHSSRDWNTNTQHNNRQNFEVLRSVNNRESFTELTLEGQEQVVIDQLLAEHQKCMMAGIHDERYWNKTSFLLSMLREIRDRKETTGRWGNDYGEE